MGMLGIVMKIRVYVARRGCALNSKTSAKNNAPTEEEVAMMYSNRLYAFA